MWVNWPVPLYFYLCIGRYIQCTVTVNDYPYLQLVICIMYGGCVSYIISSHACSTYTYSIYTVYMHALLLLYYVNRTYVCLIGIAQKLELILRVMIIKSRSVSMESSRWSDRNCAHAALYSFFMFTKSDMSNFTFHNIFIDSPTVFIFSFSHPPSSLKHILVLLCHLITAISKNRVTGQNALSSHA